MNWDSIKTIWNEQKEINKDREDIEVLVNNIKSVNDGFRRSLFWRDVREVGTAFLLVAIFVYLGSSEPFLQKIGAWFNAACCFGVGLFFLWSRIHARRKPRQFPSTVKGALEADLWDLRFQERLLRTVNWWYLLPLGIGLTVWLVTSTVGSSGRFGWLFLIPALLGIAALYYWIYRLNQKAVETDIQPKQNSIISILHQWDE